MKKTKGNGKKQRKPGILRLKDLRLMNDAKVEKVVEVFQAELKNNPNIPVVLDLTSINKIASKGIAVVVGLYKECLEQKREICIEIADERIMQFFQMLKLTKVLTVKKV